MPLSRMQHASVIVNNWLLVYGGVNGESKQYLSDFSLYDFDTNDWAPVIVTPLNEQEKIGKLAMHSMTWKYDRKNKGQTDHYVYLFGGKSEKKRDFNNDLWLLEIFNKKKNLKMKNLFTKNWFSLKKLFPDGTPPLPRYMHSSWIFGNYLVIYGGRNDNLCDPVNQNFAPEDVANSPKGYSTIALNDIWMYHTINNTWTTVLLHGHIPKSRWGAGIWECDHKMYLFGGWSWNEYSKADLFTLSQNEPEDEKPK